MAGLDDLYAQIPTSDIASKLGADQGEVDSAIRTLVPVLLGGLQHNAQDPEDASKIESAANDQAASGLLDAGGIGHVNEDEGHQAISALFGGKDSDQVAAALAGGGGGNSGLLKQLMPILLPIVLAYVGKQLSGGGGAAPQKEAASGGGLGDVLGSILGGGSSNNNALGSVLGGKGGGLGDVLGGLLGGKK
jgi:hypothetical protein